MQVIVSKTFTASRGSYHIIKPFLCEVISKVMAKLLLTYLSRKKP